MDIGFAPTEAERRQSRNLIAVEEYQMEITSSQRAYLRGLAHSLDPIFRIGKESVTPEFTEAVSEALEKRELIKISVLKNCDEKAYDLADKVAARTRSQVVQVIGRRFVLYRRSKEDPKIELPPPHKKNG